MTPIQNEVRELTPIQNEVRELTPMCLKVRELTPLYTGNPEGPERPPTHLKSITSNKATELIPIQNEVKQLTPLHTSDTEGPEATTGAKTLLGLLVLPHKSPNADTAPITNSHMSDTASNTYKSLTADTDLNTNNNPINGPITYESKTFPLAHKSNQSLILDTDYTKTHHIKSMYFTNT